MDPHPSVLHPEDKIGQAIDTIMKNRYRRLPVIDDEGRFVGVFGVSCLLRLVMPRAVVMEDGLESVPYVRETLSDLHRRLNKVKDEPISLCMREEMVRVGPDTPLLETLRILYRNRASLPVVEPDSGRLLGVNPFDQPGVEAYKRAMFRLLGKPGA